MIYIYIYMSNSPRLSQPILTNEELKTIPKGTPLVYSDTYGDTYGHFSGIHPTEPKQYALIDPIYKPKDSKKYSVEKTYVSWPGDPNRKHATPVNYMSIGQRHPDWPKIGLRRLENPIQAEIELRPPLYEGDEGGREYNSAKKRFEENASKGGRRKKNKKTKRNKKHQNKAKSKRRKM